ncbi:MAG: hypothetical protein ABIN80_28605 [Dyadobacter sp.]|uniref:hypothetical protein n=1 Tax=Dyadobacter sp. TaxID=1914288 RepID=UPI0032639729
MEKIDVKVAASVIRFILELAVYRRYLEMLVRCGIANQDELTDIENQIKWAFTILDIHRIDPGSN